ncbi:MAG: carbohydrate ABC transporter permease [Anaerolineae bacterium]|nr:carbohydrate ABC transporter permease [Anaerolineae bacterium]
MLIAVGVLFIVPFVFILLTASKTQTEAALFEFSLPTEFSLFQNLWEVIQFRDYRIILALWNSTLLTVGSVVLIVMLAAGVAFVIQRRNDRVAAIMNLLMLIGLIIPPAVVPTIYVLQEIGLYKTLIGLIFVEVSIQLPFAVLILRAFLATIPREIDEAAIIDGASAWQLFLRVIVPLLRPAIITIVVVSTVIIYNDFTLPLYFLPGNENVTAQLTLFSYISQFSSRWDLLFANVIIITIPPLIMYIFFQKQIVAGLTSGAVKG